MPTQLTDTDLLAALRTGSEDAFDTIFRTYYARLVRLTDGLLGQRAPAEEIVQDVMLELWRRRETIRVQQSLQAYLFRAARNRALNYIRHEKVVQRGSVYAAVESVSAPVGDRALREHEIDVALQAVLADLPPRCREVFQLSRLHGLTYNEIAETLDISVKTVEAQMSKALRIVRARLAHLAD